MYIALAMFPVLFLSTLKIISSLGRSKRILQKHNKIKIIVVPAHSCCLLKSARLFFLLKGRRANSHGSIKHAALSPDSLNKKKEKGKRNSFGRCLSPPFENVSMHPLKLTPVAAKKGIGLRK